MWISKPSINLKDIKYFKDISSEKVLKMLAGILDTELTELTELTEDTYTTSNTKYRLYGVTIEITPDFSYLSLKDTLEFVESTINSIAKNRDNNQLEDLYKATVMNAFIYNLLKGYLFFKKEDKEIIKSKLVNIDTIRTYLTRLNHSDDKEVFDLKDLNNKTIAVLKSTLKELGYSYIVKDNKLHLGVIDEDVN